LDTIIYVNIYINLLDFMPERLKPHYAFAVSIRENGP
jgi:hypothetical protein